MDHEPGPVTYTGSDVYAGRAGAELQQQTRMSTIAKTPKTLYLSGSITTA
jgi:hypothetical protein